MIRQQLQFIYFLAQSYEHWDALEFDEAFCCMANLVKALQRDCRINEGFLLMDCIGILQQQLLILESLSKMQQLLKEKNQFAVIENIDYIIPLMFTMQTNALIREKQEKYDSAKQEEELNELFDAMHIDCMELQFGILKRMKFDDKITWIVEI